ncbi:MAG: MoaD/ThiS family protein [Armatimonadetes bacterium]|nr:MoaD/ThiS family protein [Armatimonadota bacterium]
MKIKVRYFAVLRDRRGVGEELIETDVRTVRELVESLIRQHSLGLPPSLIRAAVNGSFANDGDKLSDGDEVVLLPPVSGG